MSVSGLINLINKIVTYSGQMVSWLSLVMVLVTFVVVVMRYGFDSGSIALQESITYIHATLFLVGAAWTMQQDAHVRVDIFYANFSKETRAWVDFIGSVFFLIPVMVFISWVSWEYISNSWAVYEGSREAGGLDGVYLLKSLILVFTGLLILQGFVQTLESFLILIKPQTTTKESD